MSIDLTRERRKLLWLKGKVAEQERWVRELEQREQDPLDVAFEREQGAAAIDEVGEMPAQASALPEAAEPDAASARVVGHAPTVRMAGPWATSWKREVRRLPPKWSAIIEFIGADGKSLTEVMQFIDLRDLQLTADTVRAGLMNYRRDFGLLENPKRGRYVATQKALDIIAATKDESLTKGEALESQPTDKEATHPA
jgi:hypothetical protein